MIRLGHLLALPPDLAAAAEKLPPALEGDSRTEQFNPAIRVVAGQQIATDLLPADAAARVKSLPPADQAAGTTSDYCR